MGQTSTRPDQSATDASDAENAHTESQIRHELNTVASLASSLTPPAVAISWTNAERFLPVLTNEIKHAVESANQALTNDPDIPLPQMLYFTNQADTTENGPAGYTIRGGGVNGKNSLAFSIPFTRELSLPDLQAILAHEADHIGKTSTGISPDELRLGEFRADRKAPALELTNALLTLVRKHPTLYEDTSDFRYRIEFLIRQAYLDDDRLKWDASIAMKKHTPSFQLDKPEKQATSAIPDRAINLSDMERAAMLQAKRDVSTLDQLVRSQSLDEHAQAQFMQHIREQAKTLTLPLRQPTEPQSRATPHTMLTALLFRELISIKLPERDCEFER